MLQLAVDLLDDIAAAGRPADPVIGDFLRQRPDLAAADRGSVLSRADQVLRRQAALDWWLRRVGAPAPGMRLRVLADLVLADRREPAAVAALCSGRGAAPPPLRPGEAATLAALAGQPLLHPDMPLPERAGFPAWLEPHLRDAFGDRVEVEMQAMAVAAPVDLRVNTLQSGRPAVQAMLAAAGIAAQPTPWSPVGLRLAAPLDLGRCTALHEGLVEPQDEGSQLAALLVDAEPGQFVIDFCAGAGGKTLALAAAMGNRGRLVAADVLPGRLDRARLRLRRAGVHIAVCRDSGERRWFKRQAGRADRVLVDAPCTGIGSWHRIADARWRLRPEDLAELVVRQRQIVDQAAPLLAPGGRLIYVTCSVLPAENEAQVRWLLERRPELAVRPVAEVWARTIGGLCPADGPFLQLTTARHGTGGFFVAVLERVSA